ncbi:hypothetical protein GGS20DRAFT_494749 [Poronia punctata]|nr:hypothetical protein GGS20DRAFT_494749 [Poronia punctata]
MTSTQGSDNSLENSERRFSHGRPRFNSNSTADRLEEGSRLSGLPFSSSGSRIRKGRRSVFREVGLEEDEGEDGSSRSSSEKEKSRISVERAPTTYEQDEIPTEADSTREKPRWLTRLASIRRPNVKTGTGATPPPRAVSGIHRLTLIALFIAIILPAIRYNSGQRNGDMNGAEAGVIREPIVPSNLETRNDSPTQVCKRWAGQSAVVNGTLYYYGGRSMTSADQDPENTWNNDFITIDLTKSWDIESPSIKGLPKPDGPPAVSLGYLWNDLDHLYLYGGQFQLDTSPTPVSIWQYDIASSTWTEFENPKTSSGEFSDAGDAPVQRAAEGAGISVPELGLSWYFGGHLDWATTPGWTNLIDRVYLKSLLEFTHPGYANEQVDSLHDSGAPDGGAFRNITWAGTQNQDGFTERADGVLVYVPGWGKGGILLGLGGGLVGDHETTDAFAPMDTIDVYDIASSEWYHQETSGDEKPQVRVNPCAVVFSAPDASSFNIYMYGGQNLLPYGKQTQYTDVWILTIPSFTWIKVDSPDSEPVARAGHSCAARDGQIVVVGGYIGTEEGCESPGIYAFDASKLSWNPSFKAADHPADAHVDNTVLAGSYGYLVPDVVQSVIGGSSKGGATATEPASGPATGGPFKTGTPPVFTVTAPGQQGPTATVTNTPGKGDGDGGGGLGTPSDINDNDKDDNNAGQIAAGVIAGLAGLSAIYLGFCAWLWRRQVRAYKRHMAVANQYHDDYTGDVISVVPPTAAAVKQPTTTRYSSSGGSGGNDRDNRDRDHFAWVGQLHPPGEPKFMSSSDEPSPGSTHRTGSGSIIGRPRPSEDRNPFGFGGGGGGVYDGFAGDTTTGGGGLERAKSDATRSTRSGESAEALLDGREPNFFSVVLGPRRALRVVNGMEE